MTPSSHEEFELRDVDRNAFENKVGMSIEDYIRKGNYVNESLLKEHEIDLQIENSRKPKPQEKEEEYTGTEILIDGEYKPEFDSDGLSIDYEGGEDE